MGEPDFIGSRLESVLKRKGKVIFAALTMAVLVLEKAVLVLGTHQLLSRFVARQLILEVLNVFAPPLPPIRQLSWIQRLHSVGVFGKELVF